MGSVIVFVWCFLFVGLVGLVSGENWDIDYNRLELLETDSQSPVSPQTAFATSFQYDSRRSHRSRRRPVHKSNLRVAGYTHERDTLPDGINHQKNTNTRMIYKAREDPSLFYRRNDSHNHLINDKLSNEYAHEETTLLHRKYDPLQNNKNNYDIKTNSIYKSREDPSLFYEQNNRIDDSNHRDSRNDTWSGKIVNSKDLAILESQYPEHKPLRKFRQSGRALVRSGEKVHVGPEEHENIGYNTVQHISPRSNRMSLEKERQYGIKSYQMKGHNGADTNGINKPCVRCPYERTLVGKLGQGNVMLLRPKLMTCNGDHVGPETEFKRMYGPDFGTLLTEGSHLIVASVAHYGYEIQLCQFRVHVVLQRCPQPRGVIVRCDVPQEPPLTRHSPQERLSPRNVTHGAPAGAWCDFTCRDSTKHMSGSSALVCGRDLQWRGTPPHCKVKSWCSRPVAPKHGRLVCRGRALTDVAFEHGSRCRARCPRGRVSRPALAICRRGVWTDTLACEPKLTHVSDE